MKVVFQERKYAPIPFWFLNGNENEKELTRQLELAEKGGIRGFTLHSRGLNRIPYMSARWLEIIRHICSESKRLGLDVWIYDEDDYPSGAVGGALAAKGEYYRNKVLAYIRTTAKEAMKAEHRIAVFPENDLEHRAEPSALPPETPVLLFKRELNIWERLPDYFNREVCEEFLRMTHFKYKEAVGDFFGTTVKAFYTDDFNFTVIDDGSSHFPYADFLPEVFEKKYGYSLVDKLSSLVEPLPGSDKVRLDYRECLCDLFIEAYIRPILEWCESNNLEFTGHLLGDEGPLVFEATNYSDPMPFYEYETIPGIDDFLAGNPTGRYLQGPFNTPRDRGYAQEGYSMIQLCKKASSVANQIKKGLCSSEVLACLCWGMPFRTGLTQIRTELGLGINRIIPHGFYYSVGGASKRDCPKSFFFHSPCYRMYEELMAGINRSMQLLSRGRTDAKILVIYPVRSVWPLMSGAVIGDNYTPVCNPVREDGRTVQEVNDLLSELSLKLMRIHADFDFGSEEQMERLGAPEGTVYRLGHCAYDTILIPDLLNIRPGLLEQLEKFISAGGRVIVLGRAPEMVGGEKTSAPLFENALHAKDLQDLTNEMLDSVLDFRAAKNGTEEIMATVRAVDGKREYYLLNLGADTDTLSLSLPGYEIYLPRENRVLIENGKTPDAFPLRVGEAAHLLPEGTADAPKEEIRNLFASPAMKALSIPMQWKRTARHPNTLALDFAKNLRGSLIFFDQQDRNEKHRIGAEFSIDFHLPFVPADAMLFVEPETGRDWTLNGIKLDFSHGVIHRASSDLSGIPVAEYLRPGKNELFFRANVSRMETIYLEGSFAVFADGQHPAVCGESTGLFCDLAKNGYMFYWGTFDYDTEFALEEIPEGPLFLRIPAAEGVLEAEINGVRVNPAVRAPWDFPVTGLLRKGQNHVRVSVTNEAQNFFGSVRAGRYMGSGDAYHPDYGRETRNWDYALSEFGIFEEPVFLGK